MGLLTGLVQGANIAMGRRLGRLDQQRAEMISARRYEDQKAHQNRLFEHQVQQADWANQFAQDRFAWEQQTEAENRAEREGRYGVEDERYNRSQTHLESQAAIGNQRAQAEFEHRKRQDEIRQGQYERSQTHLEREAAIGNQRAQAELDRRIRQDEIAEAWRQKGFDYGSEQDRIRHDQFDRSQTHRERQAELDTALRTKQTDAEIAYKQEYLDYLRGRSAAGARGAGSRGIDSKTMEFVTDMAEADARSFINSRGGETSFWPDPKMEPVHQADHLRKSGAAFMRKMMILFPGNPQEALKYVLPYWGKMLQAGEDGAYGKDIQEDIQRYAKHGRGYGRRAQEDKMFNAFLWGAMEYAGIPPGPGLQDSGITEVENEPVSWSGRILDVIRPSDDFYNRPSWMAE